jgi:hypothetical protein
VDTLNGLEPIATFCGGWGCSCPQLLVNQTAPAERRITITDDFGQHIQMSTEKFASLITEAKSGKLDTVATTPT